LQDRWYDTHRIREETGWAPKVPLHDALYRTWKAGR
jgi:nucleoside-diphosphate-sugar epimerase